MYYRENDKIVEHYSNEGLDDDNNKFPWWLLVLIIILVVVIACCAIAYMNTSSKGKSQKFGFKFF